MSRASNCSYTRQYGEAEALWKIGRGFVVHDLPWTVEKLREIPLFEFESWAVIALGGKDTGHLDFMDVWYLIQVERKDKVGRRDVDQFEAVMTREDRTKGFFVAFDYLSDALTEIDRYFKKSGKAIIPLIVREILDEQIAKKLA